MIIKIGTDRFWVKSSNIERWAEMLAELPETIECKSKHQIAKNYLSYKSDENGRIVNADEVYGLFGAEKSAGTYLIAGSNFIKECESGFCLTKRAAEFVDLYKKNHGWEMYLGEQLLRFSIRVRSIAIALLNGGQLVLPNGFKGVLSTAFIHFENKDYYIFSSDPNHVNINSLINSYPGKVFGDFWRNELGIDIDESIEIKGANKDFPSLGSISTYIKIPLMLFEYLKWLKEDGEGKYNLDKYKLKSGVCQETYDSLMLGGCRDNIEILKDLIVKYSDARGFFPVGIVGSILKEKLDDALDMGEEQWIDRFFITGVNEGIFRIINHEQGQPRHGRGLLGKKDYQLLQLKFHD